MSATSGRTDYLFHYRATVAGIYDGDSLTLDIDLGLGIWAMGQKVRLHGVDTPEIRGEERPLGLAVRDQVERWIPVWSPVTVQTHRDRKGRYGRWLVTVWPDGWTESINARLLREGLAEEYPR